MSSRSGVEGNGGPRMEIADKARGEIRTAQRRRQVIITEFRRLGVLIADLEAVILAAGVETETQPAPAIESGAIEG